VNDRSATRRRGTLAQIAAQLGVSVMTVSNAYNRPDQLPLGYVSESSRKHENSAIQDPIPWHGVCGRVAPARSESYTTRGHHSSSKTPVPSPSSRASAPRSSARLWACCSFPARGLTEATPGRSTQLSSTVSSCTNVADTDPQVAAALTRRPTVVDQPHLEGVPFVGIDDTAAAAAAAGHLIELGHRRIAVISFALAHDGAEGPASLARQQTATYAVTRARLAGYRTALSDAGIAWDQIEVYECPGSSPRLGRLAADRLLAERPRPSALLATCDALALGALDAARQRGLRVLVGPTERFDR
jgi:DNA-binding LacI/PurR family transcriptional regulator